MEKEHLYLVIFIVFMVLLIVLFGGILASSFSGFAINSWSNKTYPTIGNLAVINQIISDIGNYPLPPPNIPMDITGTLNNFNCGNSSLFDFSGSEGNTTTAGYYASYNLQIETVKSGFDFTVSEITPTSTESAGLQLVTGNFIASFNAEITVNATVKAKAEVYIPQSQTCLTVCGPCCYNPLEKCCYEFNCNCSTTCTTWPSTYTSDLLIPVTVPATLTISGGTITCGISYSASNDSSLTPIGSILKKTHVSEYTGKRFYMFDLLLSNMTLSYPSSGAKATLDGNSEIINDSIVEEFINMLISSLQSSANSYFETMTFDVFKNGI